MLLFINSNAVSGCFSALEVLLFMSLSYFISRVAHYNNLRILYCLRRPLHLCFPQLSLFFPSPLTSPFLSRLSALLLTLCIALLTIASFSFVGESQKAFRPEKVPYLITGAKDEFVDYRSHTTPDGKLASLFFIMNAERTCESRLHNQTMRFEKFLDVPGDINEVKWPLPSTNLRNHTCLVQNSGFEPRRIDTYRDIDLSVIESAMQCNVYAFNFTHLKFNFNGEVDASSYRDLVLPECKGELHSIHCSTFNHNVCIYSINMGNHFILLSLGRVIMSKAWMFGFDIARSKLAPPPVVLSSIAYMMDAGVEFNNLARAHTIATQTVLRDVEVLRIDGTRPVTSVNVKLLLGTTCLFTLIYVGVIGVGFWGWWTVGKEREGYNAFCEVEDAKTCLWNEMERKYGLQVKGEVWRNSGHLEFVGRC